MMTRKVCHENSSIYRLRTMFIVGEWRSVHGLTRVKCKRVRFNSIRMLCVQDAKYRVALARGNRRGEEGG